MSEQQEQDISQIIDEGLEAVQSGKMPLEELLKQHPDQAELIRSEIEAAVWLTSMQNSVAPRAGFVHASRRRVVERIQQEASQRSTKHMLFGFLWPPRFAYRAAAVVVVFVVLFLTSGGLVSASQNTIPGDQLYSVKRFSEQVTYQVTGDAATRVDLSVQYAGRRLMEAQALASRGDIAKTDIALLEYQQQVKQAGVELARIPLSEAKRKVEMATFVQDHLTMHEDQLEGLKETTPAAATSTALNDAMQVTASGISNAVTVFNEVNHITPTPTPTVTETATEVPTDTPQPTLTASPESTLDPASEIDDGTPTDSLTPVPGSTLGQGQGSNNGNATWTPTPTVKSTKSPKSDGKAPGKPQEPPGKKPPPPPKGDDSSKGNSGK